MDLSDWTDRMDYGDRYVLFLRSGQTGFEHDYMDFWDGQEGDALSRLRRLECIRSYLGQSFQKSEGIIG